MFGIDAAELVLILVLGVVLFGPEKLPAFSRKAARVFVAVRDIANNAQSQLRNELGPEYADLKLQDLNPRTFVAKQFKDEIAAIDEARRDLASAGQSIKDQASSATRAAKESVASGGSTPEREVVAAEETAGLPAPPRAAPFDPEAT
ncbi:Sec-independent protein translocase subunit TatB [Arachnia propionica]|uniref:Sec-independent protein translocase subunit TatB n=1 Tax=Arachnia propionica TaxID=1750 RepID=A0A3P1T902_9ACTN|nr:sec-independent translocase [Arachnia propionica]MDO5082257.1 sec-independent translocase [Arachnia propionica]RRD05810.1 Sec-independent protein translocase subunit TatB [Arachnia propionica]